MATVIPTSLVNEGRMIAKKGILAQCVSSLFLMVVVLLIKPEHTISVIVGASAFIVPHSFFAYWAFRYAGATKNNLVAQSFNQGLKVKLALTIIFFAIAFSQLNAAPSAIFGAYAVALISQAVAMAVLSYKASK